jgi:hypothetical protein
MQGISRGSGVPWIGPADAKRSFVMSNVHDVITAAGTIVSIDLGRV